MTEKRFDQFEDGDNDTPSDFAMEVDEVESDEDDCNSSSVSDMFSLYCFAIQLYHLARCTFTGYETENNSVNEVDLDSSDADVPMTEDDSATANGYNLLE